MMPRAGELNDGIPLWKLARDIRGWWPGLLAIGQQISVLGHVNLSYGWLGTCVSIALRLRLRWNVRHGFTNTGLNNSPADIQSNKTNSCFRKQKNFYSNFMVFVAFHFVTIGEWRFEWNCRFHFTTYSYVWLGERLSKTKSPSLRAPIWIWSHSFSHSLILCLIVV